MGRERPFQLRTPIRKAWGVVVQRDESIPNDSQTPQSLRSFGVTLLS
jgi:hypothetical protein